MADSRAGTRAGATSRAAAAFLTLGGAFLTYRAATLIGQGHAAQYVPWLEVLTYVELVLAAATTLAALGWLIRGAAWVRPTLRLTAALVVLHAVRVAVFVLARTGPAVDFDIQSGYRPLPADAWTWAEVWIAGGLAALSLVVLVVVWRRRRLTATRAAGRRP